MSTPRPKAVYFFYYAAMACLVPYMSLYYQERGLSGAQIGVLAGTIPLITWGSAPFWGGIADSRRRHHTVLMLTIVGLWLSVLALSFAATFITLLAGVIAYAFFVGPIVPLVDNAVLGILGERRADYGRVRLWGSFGWGTASLIMGPVLERAGLGWAFYGFLAFMAVNFIVSRGLPMRVISETRVAYSAGLRVLARNGRFLLLLTTALIFGINMGVLLSYQFLFLEELGASRTLMSWSMVISTLSEVPFWFISAGLMRRFGTSRMIAVALIANTIRLVAMGLMTAPWPVLPISFLNGPAFALIWSAGVADADTAAPRGLGATAQGLFSGMLFGLGAALGGFLGGPAYEAFGFAWLFLAMGVLSLGMLIVFVAARLWNRSGRRAVAQ
jgi:PPP family 3-phenylpropionic acid transporter